MLKSIIETNKLFAIEGMKDGKVDIKVSDHLLSLTEEKQIEILTEHLEDLKKDYSKYENPAPWDSNRQNNDIDKMQLQILIEVIEGLLSKI
jgi:hypothetical protein